MPTDLQQSHTKQHIITIIYTSWTYVYIPIFILLLLLFFYVYAHAASVNVLKMRRLLVFRNTNEILIDYTMAAKEERAMYNSDCLRQVTNTISGKIIIPRLPALFTRKNQWCPLFFVIFAAVRYYGTRDSATI